MNVFDWLVVASLLSSLFVLLSQIGVIRKINDAEEVLEMLVAKAILDAEIERRKELEDKIKSSYFTGGNSEH
jgi:L-serine deaminase